jgi:hypothetical protein
MGIKTGKLLLKVSPVDFFAKQHQLVMHVDKIRQKRMKQVALTIIGAFSCRILQGFTAQRYIFLRNNTSKK